MLRRQQPLLMRQVQLAALGTILAVLGLMLHARIMLLIRGDAGLLISLVYKLL